jgi:hypothetical protein
MTELHADPGGRVRMHEFHDSFPGRLLFVVPEASATGRDARLGRDTGHFGEHQACAAGRTGAVMNEVPIGRHSLDGGIHVHR